MATQTITWVVDDGYDVGTVTVDTGDLTDEISCLGVDKLLWRNAGGTLAVAVRVPDSTGATLVGYNSNASGYVVNSSSSNFGRLLGPILPPRCFLIATGTGTGQAVVIYRVWRRRRRRRG